MVYRLGSLGDTIMALPVFHFIRRRFAQASITLLTTTLAESKMTPVYEILKKAGLVDDMVEYPLSMRNLRAILRLRRDIANRNYQWLIHLAEPRGRWGSFRDAVFFRACGHQRLIGLPWAAADLYARPNSDGQTEWEAARLARRVQRLGEVDLQADTSWDLRLTVEEKSAAKSLLASLELPADFIVMSAGTRNEVKDWTEPNWVALAQRLAQMRVTKGILMIGAPDERDRSGRCLRAWQGPSANLCGQIDHRLSAAILQRARLFVGHDSGPMHLAGAVGTPCVAIFSSRNWPRQWFPRGQGHTILYHRVPCGGCNLTQCTRHAKRCVLSITVSEVLQAVIDQLSKPNGSVAMTAADAGKGQIR
jgi:ADP-heptose:LPS heptosyltransferase